MISVGKSLDLCMVTVLGSEVGARNSQAKKTAMTSHYNAYRSRHFKIKVVVIDGESSAAKAALDTNEVEFAPLPAGVGLSEGIYRTHLVNTSRLHRALWTIA